MRVAEELDVLAEILATMRGRAARGDRRARIIAVAIEEMIAEREQRLADEGETDPAARAPRRCGP